MTEAKIFKFPDLIWSWMWRRGCMATWPTALPTAGTSWRIERVEVGTRGTIGNGCDWVEWSDWGDRVIGVIELILVMGWGGAWLLYNTVGLGMGGGTTCDTLGSRRASSWTATATTPGSSSESWTNKNNIENRAGKRCVNVIEPSLSNPSG